MRSTRKTAAVIVVLAVALTATACGGGKSSKATPNQTPIKATDNGMNYQDRAAVRQGGIFNWPVEQYSTQWNLNETDGTATDTAAVALAMMPNALHSKADGSIFWNTSYVLDAAVTSTSPYQVVTYHLNPKAKWSDGAPLDASDYIATWKADNGSDPAYNAANTKPFVNISDVKAGKDNFEVVVTFKTPYADWPAIFSTVYPSKYIGTADEFNKGWLEKFPVTAGPFKLDANGLNKTDQTVTVVADPNWWGDKPKLDKIVFKTMKRDAMAGAFANGAVDQFAVGVDADALSAAKKVAGAEIRKAAGPDWRHLTINGQSPALKDVLVRKAIFEAVDRDAIRDSDLAGLDWQSTETLNNHIYMSNQKGYQDNSGGLKFDPVQAKKDLTAAGYTIGSDGKAMKDGRQLEFNLVAFAGIKVSTNEANLVQQMLADNLGIKVDINAYDKVFDDYLTPGKFDLTAFTWSDSVFGVANAQSFYANPLTPDNIGQNYTRIGSKAIDDAFAKAESDTDAKQEVSDANAADALVWAEYNELPLYQRPQIYAVKKNVANFGAPGFADFVYENIGFTS
ncbi:peptide/nickel transport system substrate-binding protein [Catenulispora sp. MAP5-51]|uniref:ABC transporter family substrate-binding protein n=1 Tax=Catenulispora sp. MAP5-51 TaxID=3156298 RepID=UPI00351558BA